MITTPAVTLSATPATPLPTTLPPAPDLNTLRNINIPLSELKLDTVIQNEMERINVKKESIDKIQQGQSRVNMFNDSYRKRYLAYIKIIMIIVISLVVVWLLRLVESYGFISEEVNNFIIIGVISITLIIIYSMYNEILRHDLLNYDELAIKSPDLYDITKLKTQPPDTTATAKSTASPTCAVPQNYCGTGTVYDKSSNKCIAPTPTPTPTL